MTTVSTSTYKRVDAMGKHRVVMMRYDYGNGDDTIVINTGLKIVYSYSISPNSKSAKPNLHAALSGGTITLTVTDPTEAAYLYVTAFGI